jgi:hypothetical protein
MLTVWELIYELSKGEPDDEAVVCLSPRSSARILGVHRKGKFIHLDFSMEERDKVEGLFSEGISDSSTA